MYFEFMEFVVLGVCLNNSKIFVIFRILTKDTFHSKSSFN